MSNGHATLELSSLRTRHMPIGEALFHRCAPAAIVRLSIDPTAIPSGTMEREAAVDWLRRPGRGTEEQVTRTISWADVRQAFEKVCEQLPITTNAHDLTEDAAVGVAALLISDLEGEILQTVLPIGSGGDYLVRISQVSSPIQIEMSGIREDVTGSASRSRLTQKSDQVLTKARVGFVSVTAFAHGSGATVQSCLHFVKKKRGGKKGRSKRRGKGKK